MAVLGLPTKYVVESPGPLDEVARYITMPEKPKAKGKLYSTSVSIRPALVFDYLFAGFVPYHELALKSDVYGSGDVEGWDKISDYDMHQGTNLALLTASKKAKIPAKTTFDGMFVMDVQEGSDFYNRLKVGDLITKIDQKQFADTTEMQKYLSGKEVGQKVELTVLRDKKEKQISGKLILVKATKKPGIGMTLGSQISVTTTPKVKINVTDLGGPSAGLMFTLELYQEFTGKSLTGGKKIAGTGTIDENGKVGIIGGVDKKVAAAAKAKAVVFFAPTDQPSGVKKSETNYTEAVRTAKELKTKMKIVPVATFEDALDYLTQHE